MGKVIPTKKGERNAYWSGNFFYRHDYRFGVYLKENGKRAKAYYNYKVWRSMSVNERWQIYTESLGTVKIRLAW